MEAQLMRQKSLNHEEKKKPTCDRSSEKELQTQVENTSICLQFKKKKKKERKINIIEQDELLS